MDRIRWDHNTVFVTLANTGRDSKNVLKLTDSFPEDKLKCIKNYIFETINYRPNNRKMYIDEDIFFVASEDDNTNCTTDS